MESNAGPAGPDRKKGGGKRPGAAGRKPARNRWPLLLTVTVPTAAVALLLLYYSGGTFARMVDRGCERLDELFGSRGSAAAHKPALEEPGREPAPAPAEAPVIPDSQPRQRISRPTAPPPESTPGPGEPGPAAKAAKARPRPAAPTGLPKREKRLDPFPAAGRVQSVSTREAHALARAVFGGRVASSSSSAGSAWYSLVLEDARKRYPYAVRPVKVEVATTALAGKFLGEREGFVAFFKVEDPAAPQWKSTYVGATLFDGSVDKPGRVRGSTALEAARGEIVRREALDVQGDGTAELLLEVELAAPGGLQYRELALHRFRASGTVSMFHVRTLDDGPGVPSRAAELREVVVTDADRDGHAEIVVTEARNHYRINEDQTRTLVRRTTGLATSYRLTGSRYEVARK